MSIARISRYALAVHLCVIVLASCQGQRSEALNEGQGTARTRSGMITFARWMKESSLDPASYDAVAFVMNGTCHGCQASFDRMLTTTTKRILVVSSDPTTVLRYKQSGANVHYDSTSQMEYIDSMTTQTTVFFTSANASNPTVVALDPGTVTKVVERLR